MRVLRFALLTGIVGPLLAVLTFYIAFVLCRTEPKSLTGVETVPAITMIGVYVIYATLIYGPVAGVLGALGTWLLLKAHGAGIRSWNLVILAVCMGVLFGCLCVPLSLGFTFLVLFPRSVFQEVWREVPTFLNVHNPYTLVGCVAGGLLGLFVGVRLSFRTTE